MLTSMPADTSQHPLPATNSVRSSSNHKKSKELSGALNGIPDVSFGRLIGFEDCQREERNDSKSDGRKIIETWERKVGLVGAGDTGSGAPVFICESRSERSFSAHCLAGGHC